MRSSFCDIKIRLWVFLAAVIHASVAGSVKPATAIKDIDASPHFAFGATVGFNASATYPTNIYADGHRLNDYWQDTQIGKYTSLIVRYKSNNVLLQSGIGITFNKSSFSIDLNSWNKEAEGKKNLSCSYGIMSFKVPLQVGYYFINQYPYSLSVYTGPSLRYTPDNFYSVKYRSDKPQTDITDLPRKFITGWTGGLVVQIGKTFLNIEYEATISTITESISIEGDNAICSALSMNKRIGIISFAYGITF